MSCEFPNGFRCWNQGFSLIFPLAELRTCTEPWTTAWGAGSSPRRRRKGPWGLGIQFLVTGSVGEFFRDDSMILNVWSDAFLSCSISLKPTKNAQRTLVHILDISWYISTQKFDFNRYLPLHINLICIGGQVTKSRKVSFFASVMAVFSATWQIPCEWEESNMVDELYEVNVPRSPSAIFWQRHANIKAKPLGKNVGQPDIWELQHQYLKLHPDPIMSITTTKNILLEMSSCTSEICIFWRIADCCEALNLGWAKNGHKNRSNVGRTNA